MLFKEIISLYSANYVNPINTLCGKMQTLKDMVHIVIMGFKRLILLNPALTVIDDEHSTQFVFR
jgi:hypothetical protein